jgi:hypothetical protein
MGKMARERELKERRQLKQEKKDERKLAAAEASENPVDDVAIPEEPELTD